MGILRGAAKYFQDDVVKQFASAAGLQKGMKNVTSEVSRFIGQPKGAFGKAFGAGMQKVHSDAGLTGAVYGAAAGGVGGIASSDRDVGFFTGAAMGGVAGHRSMTGGIRGSTAKGAIMGGLYGAVADDTSIMGGAMMGAAGFGHARRYAKGFNRIRKIKPRIGTNQAGKKVSRGGGGFKKAARATANAMKKDVGRHWRGQRTRASKNTATMGSNSGGMHGPYNQQDQYANDFASDMYRNWQQNRNIGY